MSELEQSQDVFSFLVGVRGLDVNNTAYADLLYEAGCSDAVVFIENGELFLEFDREAESFEEAVRSATKDIQKAGGSVIFTERHRR
jgi:hypothetical protein